MMTFVHSGIRHLRWFGALVLITLLSVLLTNEVQGEVTPQQQPQRGSSFEGFPLWKDIPTKAFAVLGRGKVRGTRWEVFAFRGPSASLGGKQPCIQVAHITLNGMYGYSRECGPLAPARGLTTTPVYALTGSSHRDTPGGPTVGESFLGMTVSSQVIDLRLELSGPSISRRTRLISARQSRKANVRQFRYIALGLARDACISHVVGVNLQGSVLIDADANECG